MNMLDKFRQPDAPVPAVSSAPSAPAVTQDLNAMLLALKRYGHPSVRSSPILNGRWGAYIKMHVEAAGSSFEISSEYHDTPVAAVQQLTERIEATLAKWR